MVRIAVIGAGLAGLFAARELSLGNDVSIFEKARGPGGRMATRYAGDYEFDHGAQFFTARSARFKRFLRPAIRDGVIAEWPARFVELSESGMSAARRWDSHHPHYVGSPRMNAVGKWLAEGLDLRCGQRVEALVATDRGWQLRTAGDASAGTFDRVILAAPAVQTAALAPPGSPVHAAALAAGMHGCYALMLGFESDPGLAFDAALVRDADISWISVNSSKPGRGPATCIVVHSTNAWADAHIDDDADSVVQHLRGECSRVLNLDVDAAVHCDLQRWRYANIDAQSGAQCFVDAESRIAACGDWFIRGRIEAAFASATALCDSLESRL